MPKSLSHEEIAQHFIRAKVFDFSAMGKLIAELGPELAVSDLGWHGVELRPLQHPRLHAPRVGRSACCRRPARRWSDRDSAGERCGSKQAEIDLFLNKFGSQLIFRSLASSSEFARRLESLAGRIYESAPSQSAAKKWAPAFREIAREIKESGLTPCRAGAKPTLNSGSVARWTSRERRSTISRSTATQTPTLPRPASGRKRWSRKRRCSSMPLRRRYPDQTLRAASTISLSSWPAMPALNACLSISRSIRRSPSNSRSPTFS